jgi:hypothetical protein
MITHRMIESSGHVGSSAVGNQVEPLVSLCVVEADSLFAGRLDGLLGANGARTKQGRRIINREDPSRSEVGPCDVVTPISRTELRQ